MENDDDLKAYKNYSKIVPLANFLKYQVYESIISNLEDLAFLKLQLGIYYEKYIIKLNENIKKIGKIVLDDIHNNNYEEDKIDAILSVKEKAENLIFLRFENIEISSRKKSKKAGKPTTKIEPFKENIIKNWTKKGKEAFEGLIKQEFIDVKDKYENNKKKHLYLLALAMKELGVFNKNIENKHLIHTVGNLFINPERNITISDVSGFRTRAKTMYKTEQEYTNYKKRIETIINNRMKAYES